MDETIRRTIGNDQTLCFDIHLFPIQDERGRLAWGELLLTLEGEAVWSAESDDGQEKPVCWTWVDLLEFMGKKWAWLTLEENYPAMVFPLHPGNLRREMEKRWESMTEEQVQAEEESLFEFEGRHDLTRGLKGIFLPSLFILRQGGQAWVCSNHLRAILPFQALFDILTELGECLALYLSASTHPRARYALDCWRNRRAGGTIFWDLCSGLNAQARGELENGMGSAAREHAFARFNVASNNRGAGQAPATLCPGICPCRMASSSDRDMR